MRRRRLTLTTAVLALVASVGLAPPASADHGADMFPDEGTCRMGGLATGSYVDFWSDHITHIEKGGETKGFICRFRDLPEVIYDDYDGTPWWTLPSKASHQRNVTCWKPEVGLREDYHVGVFTTTPSGNGLLRCMF